MDRRSDPVVGVLVRARGLIETPEKWGQAPDVDGERRCLVTALLTVAGGGEPDTYRKARRCLAEATSVTDKEHDLWGYWIGRWNDAPERTHAEVLAALDRAIALRVEEIA
jgi:hypothetical protein